MGDSCFKCNQKFSNSIDILTCNACKNPFHPGCTSVRTLGNFRKLGARKATWKCDECNGDFNRRDSDNDPTDRERDLQNTIVSLNDTLTQLVNSKFDELNNKITELIATNKSLQTTIEAVKKENSTLKGQCDNLRMENDSMRKEIRELQQYSRRDNLEIVGVPQSINEDVNAVVGRLAEVIGVPFVNEQISIAHRLPSSRKDVAPPIVIKFISRSAKMQWLSASKSKGRIRSIDLNRDLPASDVYINEHLIPYNKLLLGRAKHLKRDKKLSYVWVKDCKIFVRKEKDSPARLITTVKDLEFYDK